MKTLRLLLVTALWITLCTGLCSCVKLDDVDETPDIPSINTNLLYEEYGLDPDQYKYLTSKSSPTGETSLAGLKNGHIWMAIYEANSKKKLYEIIDTEAAKEEIITNLGYGKSETLPLNDIQIGGLVQTERGAIGQLNIVYRKDVNHYNYQIHQTTFFNNGSSIKKKTIIINDNYKPTAVSKWYKDAAILSDNFTSYIERGSYCCNDKGDTLYITQTDINLSVEVISYEEAINIGSTSSRWNYKTGKLVWSSKVNDPFEIPDNTKRTTSILDKSTDIWKCKVDLLYYDGTKKDFTFSINIETGTIIGEELPISYANLKGTWDMTKCYGWEYNGEGVKEDWEEDVTGEYIFFESTHGNGGYFDGSKTNYFTSSLQGNKLILENSDWLLGKSITITKLTTTELHITATEASSVENYEMKKR